MFSTTDTVAAPSNTETAFSTNYTLPANLLGSGKILRVAFGWSLLGSGGPSVAFRVRLGGSYILNTIAAQVAPATTTYGGVQLYMQGTAAPSGSATVLVNPLMVNGNSSALCPISGDNAAPPALATNGTLVLQPYFFASANTSGNSMTLNQMIVEALN
jgi:hypothetical protein